MKQATVLGGSLVLVAATVTVWVVRDQSVSQPLELFNSQPSEFGLEYANAQTEIARRYNNSPELRLRRNKVVQLNLEEIDEFLAFSQSAPRSFGQPPLQLPSQVDLTLFSDMPCTIGAVNYANNLMGVWSLRTICVEDSQIEVSIVIDKQSERFSFTLRDTTSHPNREHQLVSLENSPYAVAFEIDHETRP